MKRFALILTSVLLLISPAFGECPAPGDVNGDGKIGLEDIIYGLQIVSGLRPVSTFSNSLGMTFRLIPAGAFIMGSTATEFAMDSSVPRHQVTISRAFYMQTTEVTQGQWKAVMGSNPSYSLSCGDNCPVEHVTWDDAQAFIVRMNQRGEGSYRLPTEAEWEYAARAGSTTAFYNGGITKPDAIDPNLDLIGWYWMNSDSKIHPVQGKQANAWGLYDTAGNVWEWVQDWYSSSYYSTAAVTDPAGPSTGVYRVVRGGAWNYEPAYCRSAYRYYYLPNVPYEYMEYIGIRLVRSQ